MQTNLHLYQKKRDASIKTSGYLIQILPFLENSEFAVKNNGTIKYINHYIDLSNSFVLAFAAYQLMVKKNPSFAIKLLEALSVNSPTTRIYYDNSSVSPDECLSEAKKLMIGKDFNLKMLNGLCVHFIMNQDKSSDSKALEILDLLKNKKPRLKGGCPSQKEARGVIH